MNPPTGTRDNHDCNQFNQPDPLFTGTDTPFRIRSRLLTQQPNTVLSELSLCCVSVSMLHRSPSVWGVRKKLSEYDPTRHVSTRSGPSLPYSYLPFGRGDPGCLASAVGNLLFKELARSFVKEFNFHSPDSYTTKLGYDGMFSYVDGSVPLVLEKRRKAK